MTESRVYEQLVSGRGKLAVVGLGYVGLPLALEFSRHVSVLGFDTSPRTLETCRQTIPGCGLLEFTDNPDRLKEACCFIVAVPTPVDRDRNPDLDCLLEAARLVGSRMSPGSLVIFESTVYPGVTETLCAPVMEQASGLVPGRDWRFGYSPERINPGDPAHCVTQVRKLVAGMDAETTREIRRIYDLIIQAGTCPVSNIRTAEAVKVMENTQRDINIAVMNELAMICHAMDLDTTEVLDAMDTKWNALGFRPGLVGGHCIGVDPYYLSAAAARAGAPSELTCLARRINEGMSSWIAQETVRELTAAGLQAASARVLVLGITFKENCPDIRNSKAAELIFRLQEAGMTVAVSDSLADPAAVRRDYGLDLVSLEQAPRADCVIVAVAHDQYRALSCEALQALFGPEVPAGSRVLMDVKSLFAPEKMKSAGFRHWRL